MKLSIVCLWILVFFIYMEMMVSSVFAQSIIDVHSHIITPEYIQAVTSHHAALEEGFPIPTWNLDAHLQWMDEVGIRQSI